MIFSVTEVETYLRCPRKAFLTSKNGRHLTVMFGPLNLSVGSLVHKAHQLWLEQPDIPLKVHAMSASVAMQTEIETRYQKQVGTKPGDAELATLYESVQFALAMCENYQTRYGTPLPPDYRLIAAEQKIRFCVPGTEHECFNCETWTQAESKNCPDCSGTGTALHCLEGRLDGLLQHIPTGRLDVLERKTYNQRPQFAVLRSNFQFLAYDWLVRQLNFNNLGTCVAYDGMWRREVPPRGRTFNDLFARYLLPERNQHERDEFAFFLPRWLQEMYRLYSKPDDWAYPVRPWNGCTGCLMDGKESAGVPSLCYAMTRGQPTEEIIRLNYSERTDDVEEQEETPA